MQATTAWGKIGVTAKFFRKHRHLFEDTLQSSFGIGLNGYHNSYKHSLQADDIVEYDFWAKGKGTLQDILSKGLTESTLGQKLLRVMRSEKEKIFVSVTDYRLFQSDVLKLVGTLSPVKNRQGIYRLEAQLKPVNLRVVAENKAKPSN